VDPDQIPLRRLAYRLWPVVVLLLLGASVRAPLLVGNRFHPDEALFASYARAIVSGQDPMLLIHWVDRPPSGFYLMAAAMGLAGQNEMAARLPDFFASLATLALTWRLAWLLWRDEASALVALAFSALSPMAVAFGATAFSDPLLVLWLAAALVATCRGRWGWTGIWFGLALGTKQSALVFLPLLAGLGMMFWRHGALLRFVVAAVAVTLAFLVWDVARGQAGGYWSVGLTVGNPNRLVRSNEVWPRAQDWLRWLQYVIGWPPLAIVAFALPVAIWGRGVRGSRSAAATLILLAYVIGYLAVYWLLAFNVFDRYLLPLVPLVGLLIGRAAQLLLRKRALLAAALTSVALVSPAWQASHDVYPIGGDHGMYDGIDRVGVFLAQLPVGTVVYDHWLGWPLSYYAFDAHVYVSWFPSPIDLTEDLLVQFEPGEPRYLVLPAWLSAAEPINAVHAANLEATTAFVTYNRHGRRSFIVYRITAPLREGVR
jgi:4-amino-4-deoxy-L-arabinose transferase-like glycosyltransferase